MMLIIPVWKVLQNFFRTMIGRWQELSRNLPAKFLIVGSLMYLVGCFQGSLEALRSLQPADALHRLRHRALAPHGLRNVRGVGDRRHDVRLAAAGRCACRRPSRSWGPAGGGPLRNQGRPALELPRRELGILARHARDLGDGARADRAGSPAGLHADGRHRMGAVGQRDPALLVGAHPHRLLDGSGHVASGLHAHEDVAENAMKSIGSLAVGAGFFFVTLAMFVQGFLPAMIPESRSRQVSRAVRTDVGDVKWVRYDASDYTPLERVGRGVYIREGCWYCHSQYVRPVTGEDLRWGPVSEAGEYAFDLPHLLSTRRIGPDLARVGLKYGDDWHYAHHWDPRVVVPDSVMPSFKWLYTQVRLPLVKTDTGPALPPAQVLRVFFTMKGGKLIPLYPNGAGLTFVSPPPD